MKSLKKKLKSAIRLVPYTYRPSEDTINLLVKIDSVYYV